jgi:regulator of replication initiation timing
VGILDTAKELVVLVQKLDNVELLKHVLELQGQLGDLLEERRALREENATLRAALALKASLFFRDNAYWKRGEGDQVEGPFCTKCYAADGKLLPMHFMRNNGWHVCPNCKTSTLLPGNEPPEIPTPRPRGGNWITDY